MRRRQTILLAIEYKASEALSRAAPEGVVVGLDLSPSTMFEMARARSLGRGGTSLDVRRLGFSGVVGLVLFGAAVAEAQIPPAPLPAMPRGLVGKLPGVSEGYVLFSPILSPTVFLMDNDARVVHTWENQYGGISHYLMPNGTLLRGARDPNILHFRTGGVSGIVQEIDWNGNVLWEWKLGDEKRVLHHDIEPLPNGNLLALAWEVKTSDEAIAAGRRPDATPEQGLMPEWVLEIQPIRPEGAKIVWEWHVWDHLVQDHDSKLADFGDPAAHPGHLDVNADAGAPPVSPEELEQLKALGYVAPDAAPEDLRADFLHANSIAYHPALDQITLSVPSLGEVWILDHSTTTTEAASSKGGRSGRGGEILYRWGNPAAYGRGDGSRPRLFFQHDIRWIPEGWQGAGNLTIFNNGRDRPAGPFSSVDEITPPLLPGRSGTYALDEGEPFGPAEPAWTAPLPPDRFAPFISGATRLQNGNTFVCAGTDGILLELTRAGSIVWEYRNPYSGDLRLADGSPPGPGIEDRPYAVFRASRIPKDHPALEGKTLVPLDPQPPWADPPGKRDPGE